MKIDKLLKDKSTWFESQEDIRRHNKLEKNHEELLKVEETM